MKNGWMMPFEFAGELVERSPIVVSCVPKVMAAEEYEDLDKRLEVETEGSRPGR